jgi:hypothetical protein
MYDKEDDDVGLLDLAPNKLLRNPSPPPGDLSSTADSSLYSTSNSSSPPLIFLAGLIDTDASFESLSALQLDFPPLDEERNWSALWALRALNAADLA